MYISPHLDTNIIYSFYVPFDGDQSAVNISASCAFQTRGFEFGVRDLIFKLVPVANKTDWESDDHATAYTGVTFWAKVDL